MYIVMMIKKEIILPNSSLVRDKSEILLLISLGNCFMIVGG